ncbi:MAG: hypothetical protein WCW40_10530, partial [Bacteroidota bacterium]
LDDQKDEPIVISMPVEEIRGIQQTPFSNFAGIESVNKILYGSRILNDRTFSSTRRAFISLSIVNDGQYRADFGLMGQWMFSCIFDRKLRLIDILATDNAIETFGKAGAEKEISRIKAKIVPM